GVEGDARDEPGAAAHLVHERMISQRREGGQQLALERAAARNQLLAFEDVDVGEPRSAHGGMSGIRLPVTDDDAARLAPERLRDTSGDAHAAEWQIPARDALRERHEVRLDPEPLEAEPGSEPAKAADDRVAHEEDVGLTADACHFIHVSLWGRQDAAGADHGL